MKNFVFATFFFCAAMYGCSEANATVTVTNNNKTQAESSSKQIETNKYNFTLFSFFNYNQKAKVDSTRVGNNSSVLMKKKEQE